MLVLSSPLLLFFYLLFPGILLLPFTLPPLTAFFLLQIVEPRKREKEKAGALMVMEEDLYYAALAFYQEALDTNR